MKYFVPLLLVSLSACVTDPSKFSTPATVEPVQTAKSLEVIRRTSVGLGGVPSVTLKHGSRWTQFGSIDQGAVYKSPKAVLMIQGHHNWEAYPVIADGKVTGVYLPVEKAFISAKSPTPLNFRSVP